MKKTLFIIIISLFILSACSSDETTQVLRDQFLEFSLGFEGNTDRTIVSDETIEFSISYTSNNKGNMLENNKLTIEGNECVIDSITPNSFSFGQEVKVNAKCSNSFKNSQVKGTLILEYLQGSTQRLAQAEFLLNVEE